MWHLVIIWGIWLKSLMKVLAIRVRILLRKKSRKWTELRCRLSLMILCYRINMRSHRVSLYRQLVRGWQNNSKKIATASTNNNHTNIQIPSASIRLISLRIVSIIFRRWARLKYFIGKNKEIWLHHCHHREESQVLIPKMISLVS